MKVKDLTGKTFGRWTVLRRAPRPEYTNETGAWWLCRCSCGVERAVYAGCLRKDRSRSCGCLRTEKLVARRRKKVEV